jgi:hypothetical protein
MYGHAEREELLRGALAVIKGSLEDMVESHFFRLVS